MGEIADALLSGEFCEQCGEYIGEAVGHPRNCGCDAGGGYGPSSRSAQKQLRRENAEKELKAAKMKPNKITNNGACWCYRAPYPRRADFYPGTGRWRDLATGTTKRGDVAAFKTWMYSEKKP